MVSLQTRTLRLYGELLARGSAWPGKLALSAGDGCAESGLAAAACIAGATCLLVDPQAKSARAAMREGGVDFVVNTLDEALRVLKNEVRQRRPLGVALVADVDAVRAEMLERGVLADLAVNTALFPAREHVALGEKPSEALVAWLGERGWAEGTVAEAPAFAAGDVRAAWVRGIARYQRSAAREARVVWG